ncbi:hypothetical protein FOMPIDRAFT_1116247 [Fomitopsis schrenkii]|uniref:Fungal-type protein kinase domain-containing protein n=1 Tax=Fomitopsis schrenkii TaxID=2126942 RepID=S8EE90_FOMSC|nr:hypothetical protein FOMPIDRAFT_1116247 [Fomitopsis schrenkii]
MRQSDVRQTSHKTQRAWKGEIAGRMILCTKPIEQFLDAFVPGEKPTKNAATVAFDMPKDARKKSDLYKPLCDGLTKLVAGFPGSNKLVFKNHNHTRTKFPYKKYHSEDHITRPDVIASFPGESDIDPHPDKWRNISLAVEAKLKESEDPMKSYSDEHELTLVQLAKSARNILVSQSRLFVFVVGIYGSLARIFRFDHAGAVCSRAFNYTASDGTPSRPMYEFLWRCTHPIAKGSSFVGDDPTVRCIKAGDHASIASKLRDKGIEIRDATETAKAYRYITVGGTNKDTKRYLAYELLFMNPHLISRATTVWKAIEVDERGDPIGSPVVIKDAWRQLVRAKEIDHYEAIFTSADATEEVFGVAHFLCGDDLSAEEHVAMECGKPGGLGVGHLTVTARHAVKPAHSHNERSHSRLVLGTVGVPLSQFKSTKELAEAFRDAVKGHQEAFEKGMLHRDISEGNDPDVPYEGFVQDFDYSLNWQRFLVRLGLAHTWEDWDNFVRAECEAVARREEAARLEEASRRAHKMATGTLYFKAIDLLSPGDVVHEARHDLAFFWLLIWILLCHTIHILGLGTCEHLFNHDDEAVCRLMKAGWFDVADVHEYVDNEPLAQLVSEFAIACKTNYRTEFAEPSDPLTYKKVIDIFEKALALESWPTIGDEAVSHDVLEFNKPPRQSGSRLESNLDNSRINSRSFLGVEPSNNLPGRQEDDQALASGLSLRRSRRLANTLAKVGSHSRKRPREARDDEGHERRVLRRRADKAHESENEQRAPRRRRAGWTEGFDSSSWS